jgi:hypothetical protein
MIVEKLDDYIYVYKNVMDEQVDIIEELSYIFNTYDKDFLPATINNHDYNTSLRSCTVFSLFCEALTDSKEYRESKYFLDKKISERLSKSIFHYIKNTGIKIKEREPWEILKYSETQDLTWHSDNGDPHPCTLSFVYYFNDDYVGGEIQFKDKIGSTAYKPEANSLIIFPSSIDFVHRVLPIQFGTKYAAISFGK